MDKALICGISGQDGAYLSRLLLEKGYEVHGTDRPDIPVDITNLQILGIDSEIEYHSLDLSNYEAILKTVDRIMPDEVYNLAAISSVGKSFEFPILN